MFALNVYSCIFIENVVRILYLCCVCIVVRIVRVLFLYHIVAGQDVAMSAQSDPPLLLAGHHTCPGDKS